MWIYVMFIYSSLPKRKQFIFYPTNLKAILVFSIFPGKFANPVDTISLFKMLCTDSSKQHFYAFLWG